MYICIILYYFKNAVNNFFFLQPGVPFFQSMDKVFQSGVGACGSVRVSLPVDGAQKEFKFMILREDEKCVTAKCGSDAGFNVSKTNNCKLQMF